MHKDLHTPAIGVLHITPGALSGASPSKTTVETHTEVC